MVSCCCCTTYCALPSVHACVACSHIFPGDVACVLPSLSHALRSANLGHPWLPVNDSRCRYIGYSSLTAFVWCEWTIVVALRGVDVLARHVVQALATVGVYRRSIPLHVRLESDTTAHISIWPACRAVMMGVVLSALCCWNGRTCRCTKGIEGVFRVWCGDELSGMYC